MKLPPLQQFLQDSNGQYSSVRAQTWLVILCFCGDWIAHIIRREPFVPDLSIVGVVLGVMGLKVGQKYVEETTDRSES